MKNLIFTILTFSMIFSLYSCDIDQTKKGSMPTVDIDVDTEAGSLPEFDIDWMEVDMGLKTKTVMVPTVEIVMVETEVEVPYIDAEWPADYEDIAEQTIAVEAEVTGTEHMLKIKEVYAKGDRLIVISELKKGDKTIGDKTMRVSDQMVINAPDLTVKHYIVGQKPARGFNNNYTYIDGKQKIAKRLNGSKKIF